MYGYIVMQLVYIQSSEGCCCVRHSQCCRWSSQHSTLLQVGVMDCVDVVATAVTQKNDHIQTKIYAAPPTYLLSSYGHLGWCPVDV